MRSRPAPSAPLHLVALLLCAAPAAPRPHPATQDAGAPEPAEATAADRLELTLAQAVGLATGNNLELEIAGVDAEVAGYEELSTWGAFDWVFDSRLTYSDSTREGSGFLSGGAETQTETGALELDLTKPLTTGGSFVAHFDSLDRRTDSVLFNEPRQREAAFSLSYVQPLRRGAWSEYATSRQREAELLFQRQREITRATRQRVTVEVTNAYWDLVSAIEQLGVAQSAINLGRNRLERNQRELDAGVGTEVDVLQARAELATREEGLLQAQNDVAQRMDDLKKMILRGEEDPVWETEIVPVTPLPADVTPQAPAWTAALAIALERRSELRQASLDVDAARVRAQRAASERLAGLNLELSAGSASVDSQRTEAIQEAAEYRFPTYTAALVYNMPIGNRTAANAERAASARVRSALLAYDRIQLDVTAEVRAAVRNVLYAAEQVRATTTSLELAQRQLAAEEARFDNDLSTTFQVLEFQQQLIVAMSNERGARVGFAKALTQLESVQGLVGEE